MNVDKDDFHITLFRDASKDIYPLNSRTSFTNCLAIPVDLGSTSDGIVGLAEICYKPPERAYVNGVYVTLLVQTTFSSIVTWLHLSL